MRQDLRDSTGGNMKRFALMLTIGIMAATVTGCGSGADQSTGSNGSASRDAPTTQETGSETGMANPWVDCTREEAVTFIPYLFKEPDGATDAAWSRTTDEPPIVQMKFTLDRLEFTARAQTTGDENRDISGMHYDWAVSEDVTLAGWAGGNMPARMHRYAGSDEYADLCTWFDFETGVSYSLSTVADDLSGFDIQAVAEAMYDAEGAEALMNDADVAEHVPMDVSDCTSLKQIIDKLRSGSGYVKTVISGTEVLMVTDYLFDFDGGGSLMAVDADVYYVGDDGLPKYAGYVSAGGTSYPLAIKDGTLYVGANPYMKKMVMLAGGLVVDEEASVEYGTDGSETYYHRSDVRDVSADENGQVPDDTVLTGLFEEYEEAEAIKFEVVK